jgi:hypothetical protein
MYNLNYTTKNLGDNVEEKIYLGVCERKKLNITGIEAEMDRIQKLGDSKCDRSRIVVCVSCMSGNADHI